MQIMFLYIYYYLWSLIYMKFEFTQHANKNRHKSPMCKFRDNMKPPM